MPTSLELLRALTDESRERTEDATNSKENLDFISTEDAVEIERRAAEWEEEMRQFKWKWAQKVLNSRRAYIASRKARKGAVSKGVMKRVFGD